LTISLSIFRRIVTVSATPLTLLIAITSPDYFASADTYP
jgi:hypothetical protein